MITFISDGKTYTAYYTQSEYYDRWLLRVRYRDGHPYPSKDEFHRAKEMAKRILTHPNQIDPNAEVY